MGAPGGLWVAVRVQRPAAAPLTPPSRLRFTAACPPAHSYSGSTATKLVATVVSGVAIGLTAAALQVAVDAASHQRNALLDRLLNQGAGLPRFFGVLLGLVGAVVLALTLLVHWWAPRAAGGGVSLVMAFLNGACGGRQGTGLHRLASCCKQCPIGLQQVPNCPTCVTAPAAGNAIQNLLTWPVYATKLLGTAAARLAGLALGIEGGWGGWHPGRPLPHQNKSRQQLPDVHGRQA